MREHAGLSVTRFCRLAEIPTSTWYRQRARHRHGAAAKGPWPRPVSDRVVAVVHALALKYPDPPKRRNRVWQTDFGEY